MAHEADHYNVGEVGRLLGVSPARVRQMLRVGELEGERGPEPVEGVPGPWRVSASAVHAFQERHRAAAEDADTTVALAHHPNGLDSGPFGHKRRVATIGIAVPSAPPACELLTTPLLFSRANTPKHG